MGNSVSSMPRNKCRKESCLDEALSVLRQAPYAELKRVSCRIEDGSLVLLRTVRSFYVKQLAQLLVANECGGELQVENRLQVQSRPEE